MIIILRRNIKLNYNRYYDDGSQDNTYNDCDDNNDDDYDDNNNNYD